MTMPNGVGLAKPSCLMILIHYLNNAFTTHRQAKCTVGICVNKRSNWINLCTYEEIYDMGRFMLAAAQFLNNNSSCCACFTQTPSNDLCRVAVLCVRRCLEAQIKCLAWRQLLYHISLFA